MTNENLPANRRRALAKWRHRAFSAFCAVVSAIFWLDTANQVFWQDANLFAFLYPLGITALSYSGFRLSLSEMNMSLPEIDQAEARRKGSQT